MNRYMKLLPLAGILLLSACVDKVDAEKNSVFELSENKFSVASGGATVTVAYKLANPVYDGTFEYSSEQEWIGDFDFSVSGEISFAVSANETASARKGRIVLSYSGASAPQEIEVVQEAYVEPEFFAFNVKDISYTGVVFDVIPADKDLTYVALAVEKEYFDSFASDEEYFQDDLAFFRSEAEAYGLGLSEFLGQSLLKGDTESRSVSELFPGEDYYIYAYGLNASGERLSDIYKTEFSTLAIDKIPMSFEISTEVNGPYMDLRIKPGDDTQTYVCGVYPAESVSSPEDAVRLYQNYINEQLALGELTGQTAAEVVAGLSSTGTIRRQYLLEPSSDYVVFAAAVNSTGLIISDATLKEFATESEIHASDNVIGIEVSAVTGRSAYYEVSVTNDDPYVLFCLPTADYAGKTDEELLEYFTGTGDLSSLVWAGDDSGTITHLSPNTGYTIFAFGYLGGQATTGLFRAGFETTDAEMSDVTIAVRHDKYYDGTEAETRYPDLYPGASGLAVFPVRIETSGDVQHNYYHIFEGDLSDESAYPYEEVVAQLMNDSYYESAMYFYLEYDTEYTIVAVSEDQDRNPGPMFREVVSLSPDGVSPVEEIGFGIGSSAMAASAGADLESSRIMALEDMQPEFGAVRTLSGVLPAGDGKPVSRR
ncbi:MAG TPA: BACON domain-containing protein [Candidatus Cryptobacteroides merdipullorum]|uniref:BACON domain-containing protein n=1 Tax=Candidatus Cryptobacteroides merdipullorum TaxID=2840771 RepID=A0A9D1KHT8_9BACT|nr:BACON domain-containing protein [Candidatus Cryptobacteroides merdipullorum]